MAVRMVVALVVLADEVNTVVSAIWTVHYGVDLMGGWHCIVKNEAWVMVILDQHYWAVHAVVERSIVGYCADPAKPRFCPSGLGPRTFGCRHVRIVANQCRW